MHSTVCARTESSGAVGSTLSAHGSSEGSRRVVSGRVLQLQDATDPRGQLEADNFEHTDLQAHYSILGQLHRQTRHLPPGTKIDSIKIESPHEDTKQKSWWQRLVG